MRHINKALQKEKLEFQEILGTRKENPLVRTRRKALYTVTEVTAWGEVKNYFILKVHGKLKGLFYDLEQATTEYNNR